MRFVAATVATVAIVTSACTDSSGPADRPSYPPVAAFAEGTCRAAAPDILALGALSRRLGNGPEVPAELKTQLRESQERLAELAVAAEPAYKPAFDRLVQSTGAVRIRADGNGYEPALGEQLDSDARAAVAACI